MKIGFIDEPELQFGAGRHIDIRFGLQHYGPLDYEWPNSKRDIRIGVVGSAETNDGILAWLEKCRGGIPAKKSRQPNLFPEFPGFGHDISFRTEFLTDSKWVGTVSRRELSSLMETENKNELIRNAVKLFESMLIDLSEKAVVDVYIVAVPMELFERMNLIDDISYAHGHLYRRHSNDSRDPVLDFHGFLKARAMGVGRPLQLVVPTTYDEKIAKRHLASKANKANKISLQDEATRAWNFFTALYYKAGGVPWRILRNANEYTSCFIGISFYNSLDKSTIQTSIAQVFNERGEGIILKGGRAQVTKVDKSPHLSKDDARKLLHDSINAYRKEHRTIPARVVLHKSSKYNKEELDGFGEAIDSLGIDMSDFISISPTNTILFRDGAYPPLRGTYIKIDNQKTILYTKGSIDFYKTYPGLYVPHPIEIRHESTDSTPRLLAHEILGLTKMNWNHTSFFESNPITLGASRKVGSILKYVDENSNVPRRYSFFM